MAPNQPKPPERPERPKRSELHLIDQKAGDHSILVANARDVIIKQLYHHPRLLFAVLLLALFAICIVFAVGASRVDIRVGFLESLIGVVCNAAGFSRPSPTSGGSIPPRSPLPSVTPEPVSTPTPLEQVSPNTTVSIALVEPTQCTVRVNGLRVRDGPGTNYPIAERVNQDDRLAPLGRNGDGTWLNIQVEATDRIGWVSGDPANVSCNAPIEGFPVVEAPPPPPVAEVPTAVPTQRPVATAQLATPPPADTPIPTLPPPTSTPADPRIGSWAGTTDQGEVITFRVEPDGIGLAALDLSVSFQFESSCPIGKVTFTSLRDAHIFDPGESFNFIGLREPQAMASLEGGISGTVASGTLTVTDTRDPSERIERNCPFNTTIKWTASKQ